MITTMGNFGWSHAAILCSLLSLSIPCLALKGEQAERRTHEVDDFDYDTAHICYANGSKDPARVYVPYFDLMTNAECTDENKYPDPYRQQCGLYFAGKDRKVALNWAYGYGYGGLSNSYADRANRAYGQWNGNYPHLQTGDIAAGNWVALNEVGRSKYAPDGFQIARFVMNEQGSIRDPHWHANAGEITYIVSGMARVTVTGLPRWDAEFKSRQRYKDYWPPERPRNNGGRSSAPKNNQKNDSKKGSKKGDRDFYKTYWKGDSWFNPDQCNGGGGWHNDDYDDDYYNGKGNSKKSKKGNNNNNDCGYHGQHFGTSWDYWGWHEYGWQEWQDWSDHWDDWWWGNMTRTMEGHERYSETFVLKPGDAFFSPEGYHHVYENIDPSDPLVGISMFDTHDLHTYDAPQVLKGFPQDIMSQVLDIDVEDVGEWYRGSRRQYSDPHPDWKEEDFEEAYDSDKRWLQFKIYDVDKGLRENPRTHINGYSGTHAVDVTTHPPLQLGRASISYTEIAPGALLEPYWVDNADEIIYVIEGEDLEVVRSGNGYLTCKDIFYIKEGYLALHEIGSTWYIRNKSADKTAKILRMFNNIEPSVTPLYDAYHSLPLHPLKSSLTKYG